MKQAFLTGERIYLRGLREADLDGNYIDWLNDAEICRHNSHHVFPYSRNVGADYIKNLDNNRQTLVLAICLNVTAEHIGNISLQRIDPISRQAEFAILMGEKEHWGQGYAKEAARLICDHGFNTLNLNRIYCGTSEENIAMQKLAQFMGMQKEGRRRQAQFKNGKYVDIMEFGVLKSEFVDVFSSKHQQKSKPVSV